MACITLLSSDSFSTLMRLERRFFDMRMVSVSFVAAFDALVAGSMSTILSSLGLPMLFSLRMLLLLACCERLWARVLRDELCLTLMFKSLLMSSLPQRH